MGTVAMKMVNDSVNAYVDMKLDLAREVIKSDDEVDELFLKVRGEILDAIREGAPDLIAITGDLISRNDTDLAPAVNLAKACTEIAPVYYVTGNHERQSSLGAQLIAQLEEAGFGRDEIQEGLQDLSDHFGVVL